jgi:hypothetical protein
MRWIQMPVLASRSGARAQQGGRATAPAAPPAYGSEAAAEAWGRSKVRVAQVQRKRE